MSRQSNLDRPQLTIMPDDSPDLGPPSVSVIVPTKNRPLLLDLCLKELAHQDYAGPYEVIVVDDGAAPEPSGVTAEQNGFSTRAVVAHAGLLAARNADRTSRQAPPFRYLAARAPGGPAAARNTGWLAATSEIVAFTDDDCLPSRSWLRCGVAAFVDGVVGVSGRIVMPLPSNPTDYELNASKLGQSWFATANCFYRRRALQAAGGFDERFRAAWREDSDLAFTLSERGARLVEEHDAIVVHPVREAPWGVSLRQQSKVRFNALLRRKHPRLYQEHIERSPTIYYPLTAGMISWLVMLAVRRPRAALFFAVPWLLGTMTFAAARLRGTRTDAAHVSEMLVTSALIPPVSLYWRLRGYLEFGRAKS